jgi:alkanesulfonate monooxygenase SsuD/methylene tetrahydromethanopterin reductase-like flavin-dependent oxidoreductase (luciferase family)
MKLGLSLDYSGAALDIPVALVQRAEALGYDSVWTAEAYGFMLLIRFDPAIMHHN